jgi:glycolate oxidase FAD binding subunit
MNVSSTNIAVRLESVIGSSRVAIDPAACSNYAIYEIIPSAVVKPASSEEVAEIVRLAALEKLAVIPCGARTKLRIGTPPSRYDIALDMTALNQIVHYDPGDLTLSAGAGTPIAKLNATLFEHHQFLPLLVPWYSLSTIGGTIASGIDSPLRQFYGTARDFLIGAEFIEGTGKHCKSGGRVVKNVTGYDLHKLLVSSLGTLAVITHLNFRTFPAPIAGSRGFVASFPDAEGTLALRRAIAQSPLTPLTLDIVNPGLAQIFATQTPAMPETAVFADEKRNTTPSSLSPIGDWFHPHQWQLCAAFAGTPEVLDRYTRDLTGLAAESRATSATMLDDTSRPSLWGRLRESLCMLLEASPTTTIFKLSVLPTQFAALFANLQQIADRAGFPHALVARAGGTLYFALLPNSTNDETIARLTQSTAQIFDAGCAFNGDATLLFAPPSFNKPLNNWRDFPLKRASVPAVGTSAPSKLQRHPSASSQLFSLKPSFSNRLKSAFDPQNIFAPGRVL